MSIPPCIIQTAKSRDLPPLARAAVTNLKLLHPDWEFRFFDDEGVNRFIATEFPQHKTTFDAFPYKIQRFDFFRYLAVYRFGGFYFDLDVLLWESLSPLLQHQAVFPFEELTLSRHLRDHYNLDWEIGNYAFGAASEDPFLGAAIENCVRGQKDPAWLEPMMAGIPSFFRSDFEVLNSTGPGLLTRTLAESPAKAAGLTVLFPADVRDEETWHRFGNYGVHAMEGSWRTKGSFIRRRLANLWEDRVKKKLMRSSHTAGSTRVLPWRVASSESATAENRPGLAAA